MLSLCIEVHIPIQKVGIVDEGGILQVVQIEGSRHNLFVLCQAEGFYFVPTKLPSLTPPPVSMIVRRSVWEPRLT